MQKKAVVFSHHIEVEEDSDLVRQGRLLRKHSYKRKLRDRNW